MNMKKNKILLLHLLCIFLLILLSLSPIIDSDFNFNSENVKNSKISGKIYISGNSGWINAKAAGTCTGSGTFNDPYIIEDLVINGGGSGSCISISYSNIYFRIENCTLSDAGVNWGDGGVNLYHVDNGQIINNSANNNDFIGIILQYCQNISISGNTANSNYAYGIGLWYSHYNNISENAFKFNGWAISLETSHKNIFTRNIANENNDDGIGIWNSFKNLFSENELDDNNQGLYLYNSIYNNISGNTISNNYIGISIDQSQCNNILNNTYTGNTIKISGTQGVCTAPPPSDPPPYDPPPYDPPPFNPSPIAFILISVIIIASAIFLTVVYKWSRGSSRQVAISVDKTREESKIKETMIKKDGIEPELKSKLIIPPETKKLNIVQEEVIPISPEKKPEDLELFEEEIVSVQEEIIEEEQVMEEIIVPAEKIVEEEQVIEETIVPAEEILEEEERIVKDIIEAPKVEINSCQFCGMELSSDVIYCLRCGHKLKK